MSIRFECDQCGSVLKIKDDLAGKPGKCPKCKTAFTVPAPEDEPVSSGESASNEASDDSGATSAKDKPGGPNKDFDLDAFLLDDDGGKPKTAKSRASKPRQQEDERSDDIDDVPDEPATKSKKDQEGDGFSIRR